MMVHRLFQFVRIAALLAPVASGAALLELKPARGIDFTLQNSPTPQKYLIETIPGGVALLDYNNDGLLDIFLVNGGHVRDITGSSISFDRRNPAYWNRLYRQNPDATSPAVPKNAGLARAGDTTMTACPISTWPTSEKIFCIITMETVPLPMSPQRLASLRAVGRLPQDFSITKMMAAWVCLLRATSIGTWRKAKPRALNGPRTARLVNFPPLLTFCITIGEMARLRM